jgi:hypothetical protein
MINLKGHQISLVHSNDRCPGFESPIGLTLVMYLYECIEI